MLDSELYDLEKSLWIAETRFDDAYMEDIFDEKFKEFGRSGKRYARSEMFFGNREPIEINAKFPLRDFAVQEISSSVYLVTYISEVKYGDDIEYANRTSIWKKNDADAWKLVFHQGTPCEKWYRNYCALFTTE